jgi:hypothetical protein
MDASLVPIILKELFLHLCLVNFAKMKSAQLEYCSLYKSEQRRG